MLASLLWLKAALNFFMNIISIVLGSHPRLVVQISQNFGDRLRLHQKESICEMSADEQLDAAVGPVGFW